MHAAKKAIVKKPTHIHINTQRDVETCMHTCAIVYPRQRSARIYRSEKIEFPHSASYIASERASATLDSCGKIVMQLKTSPPTFSRYCEDYVRGKYRSGASERIDTIYECLSTRALARYRNLCRRIFFFFFSFAASVRCMRL